MDQEIKLKELNLNVPIISETDIVLDEVIGKGSQGIVRKGLWGEVIVAVKSIKVNFNDHKRILNEIYILNKIQHENIIKMLAVYPSKDHYNILMEYFDGDSLDDILFNSRLNMVDGESDYKSIQFNLDVKNHIGYQILKAVKYLHDNRIIHGDIQVPNILVNSNYDIKLIDFGISKFEYLTENSNNLYDKVYGITDKIYIEILIGYDIWFTAKVLIEIYNEVREFALPYLNSQNYIPNVTNVPEFLKNILIACFNADYKTRPTIKFILKAYDNELCRKDPNNYACESM